MAGDQIGDWRELCRKASQEYDPEKLLDLIREINRVLSRQHDSSAESHTSPA